MRALLLIAFAAVAFPAMIAAQNDPCGAQGDDVEGCYGLTNQGHLCIFNANKNTCEKDPCGSVLNMAACIQAGCFPSYFTFGMTSAVSCVNPNMMCNILTANQCYDSGYCVFRDGYCASMLEPRIGKTDAECDISFPQWSVALIIIWVCIMVILGFIIFLIINKGKQQAIKEVERSEVQIDSLNLRDNFQLQQPLTAQP
jgi:hypothetical protein